MPSRPPLLANGSQCIALGLSLNGRRNISTNIKPIRIQVIKQGDDGVGDHQAASQTSQSSTYDMGELRSEDELQVKKRPAGKVDVRYPKRRAPNK